MCTNFQYRSNIERYIVQLVNNVFEGKRSKNAIKSCWDCYLKKWKTVHNIATHTGGGDGDEPVTDQTTTQGAEQRAKLKVFKQHWIYQAFEEV